MFNLRAFVATFLFLAKSWVLRSEKNRFVISQKRELELVVEGNAEVSMVGMVAKSVGCVEAVNDCCDFHAEPADLPIDTCFDTCYYRVTVSARTGVEREAIQEHVPYHHASKRLDKELKVPVGRG